MKLCLMSRLLIRCVCRLSASLVSTLSLLRFLVVRVVQLARSKLD